MSFLLSVIIAAGLALNGYRLFAAPKWQLLFSFPLWIYLAWGHWGSGDLNRGVVLLLLLLLIFGKRLFKPAVGAPGEGADDLGKGVGGSLNQNDDDEEELKFELRQESVGLRWRDAFPEEAEVHDRLQRWRDARYLRRLSEEPEICAAYPMPDRPEFSKRIIGRLEQNIDEYAAGQRPLQEAAKTLDLLAAMDPERAHPAIKRVVDATPEEDREEAIPEIERAVIWSRHGLRSKPPAETLTLMSDRLRNGSFEEREAAAKWKMEQDQFDWREELSFLKGLSPRALGRALYWHVPAGYRVEVLQMLISQFTIRDDTGYSDGEREILWDVVASIRRDMDSKKFDELYIEAASEFMTEVMIRVPFSVLKEREWEGVWGHFSKNVRTPGAEALYRKVVASDFERRVRDDAAAGLAANHPEESARNFMAIFRGGEAIYSAGKAAKAHSEFRSVMCREIRGFVEAGEDCDSHKLNWLGEFLLEHEGGKAASFLATHAERFGTETLADVAWAKAGHTVPGVIKELQARGLIDPQPFEGKVEKSNLFHFSMHAGEPYSTNVFSDSDEYPPRYDERIRELKEISQGGFPAERARIRVIPPVDNGGDRVVEASWYLDETRYSFLTDYCGDYLQVRWLLQGVNKSLERSGRPGRFFGFRDYSYSPSVFFGEPDAWLKASTDFFLQLHSEPEDERFSEDRFRESVLASLAGKD